MRFLVSTTIALLLVAKGALALEISPPLLLDGLALTETNIVFSYAGDLWSVPRAGGTATQLTDTPHNECWPITSPDGSEIAYAGNRSGNWDVFTLPPAGGAEPAQWTFHPKDDFPLSWSPDGKQLLFTTGRFGDGMNRFCTVSRDAALSEMLPLPMAQRGAFSPDGNRLVYAPCGWDYEFTMYRYYRGGLTSPMWITDLHDGSVDKVFGNEANHTNFFWVGDTIYYCSDETGSFNAYAWNATTRQAKPLTAFDDYGIEYMSVRDDTIAFARTGRIYLMSSDGGDPAEVAVTLVVDASGLMPKEVDADRSLSEVHASLDGSHVALSGRGEVLLYDIASKSVSNLTKSAGVAERDAALSPDGGKIAYFSDASGEYQLVIADSDGGNPVAIAVEAKPTFYRQPVWSPDGRWIAFTGRRLDLWLADVRGHSIRKVDTSEYLAQDLFHPSWSHDSRYLAYERGLPNHMHEVVVYDVEANARHVVTAGSDATRPVFDRNGKYLYYLASASAPLAASNNIWGLLSAIQHGPLVTGRVHAVVLQIGQPAPFVPGTPRVNPDAEVDKALGRVSIDWDGIGDRIVQLPLPSRGYEHLVAGAPGVLYVQTREWGESPGTGAPSLPVYGADLSKSFRLEEFAKGAEDIQALGDGRVLVRRGNSVYIHDGETGQPTRMDFGDTKLAVDPEQEWRQMYCEAWRMMRDYFYDPGHHGQDLAKLERDFAEYLPSVTRREDLNVLFRRMLGQISVSHMSIGGGDIASTGMESTRIGLLGADFVVENRRFRIERIYRRGRADSPSSLVLYAPLDQPGVDAREGDYLLSIDGKELTTNTNFYAQFEGLASEPVVIEVSADADGKDVRKSTVVPVNGANSIRRNHWDEEKRARVGAWSNDRIGYISITSFGMGEIADFVRQLVVCSDKDGIVIDQRFNGGGITSDTLIQMLTAAPLHRYGFPYGADLNVPPVHHAGPKVLITNQANFSAAETFPLMFQIAEAGTIVGMRTGGGGTGGALHYPELIDGGRITIPNRAAYNPRTGRWAENEGVVPDVEVDWMPEDFRAGHDPQLERAVDIALEQAGAPKMEKPKKPDYMVQPR